MFQVSHKGLRKLNLAHNQLRALPASFAQLQSLRILFFLGNKFTKVPSVIRALPNVRARPRGAPRRLSR
jgi:Leucine-rich repeat (LRR) protein